MKPSPEELGITVSELNEKDGTLTKQVAVDVDIVAKKVDNAAVGTKQSPNSKVTDQRKLIEKRIFSVRNSKNKRVKKVRSKILDSARELPYGSVVSINGFHMDPVKSAAYFCGKIQ